MAGKHTTIEKYCEAQVKIPSYKSQPTQNIFGLELGLTLIEVQLTCLKRAG